MKLGRPIATRVLNMQWVGGDRRLHCLGRMKTRQRRCHPALPRVVG